MLPRISTCISRNVLSACLAGLAALATAGVGHAQTLGPKRPLRTVSEDCQDLINFTGIPTGTVLTSVSGRDGLGPILVSGANPALGGRAVEAAVVFDSSNPTGEDPDLGSPNSDFGGPGIGAGGEAGSPYANMAMLGKVLIVAEDLVDANTDGLIDDPDDADVLGSTITFDFTGIGAAYVRSMAYLDIEEERPPAQVDFFDPGGGSLGTFFLEQPGDNGFATTKFNVGNVATMRITLNGSGAFDNILFDRFKDCNDNQVHDPIDIQTGFSGDCNRNGIPDECEPDCDGDGIPDVCELDCDSDGTPDDCEPDCDADGTPDDCEDDCDGDGIPDDCEPDCDSDGTPDDCEPDCDSDGTPDDCEPDCDSDGIPDDCEPDCDSDGTPDDCEPDCDSDGTPDDCEPDCDADGTPDDCEDDCDGDGIPDDCEPDCDSDGTPDDCEPDCDSDGIPDDCEPDCDSDGTPDDCEPDCDSDGTPDDCEPDCDSDGTPDDCEPDCDSDGTPDDCEPDCDSDGTPDDCESDCDGDGVPDDCDPDDGMDDPYCVSSAIADPVCTEATGDHSLHLAGVLSDYHFLPGAIYSETPTGEAHLTGIVASGTDADKRFLVDATFTGRIDPGDAGYPPPMSPKQELLDSAYAENGGPIDTDTWHYFETTEGSLVGDGDYEGAVLLFTRRGPAFQVGIGANNKNCEFGASGWLDLVVEQQPSGSYSFPWTIVGDFNLDLNDCFEPDPEELCADTAANDQYGMSPVDPRASFLEGIANDLVLESPGRLVELPDGTARFSGVLRRVNDPDKRFAVSLDLSGHLEPGDAGYPPAGSPLLLLDPSAYAANGGPIDPTTWTYYVNATGFFTGLGDYAGALLSVDSGLANFQLGFGANSHNASYGISGWIEYTTLSQPASGTFPDDGTGDLTLDLGICVEERTEICVEDAPHDSYSPSSGDSHALWIEGDRYLIDGLGSFVEHEGDGTATLTGLVRNAADLGEAFQVSVLFTERIDPGDPGYPPSGSPKKELSASAYSENGGPVDTSTWRYYAGILGVLVGVDDHDGGVLLVTRRGPAFQIGFGANGKNVELGASCWLTLTRLSQPHDGYFPHEQDGDFNLNLVECPPECPPGADGTPVVHYDFGTQFGETVFDRAGAMDLEIDEGNSNVSWVSTSVGTGLRFDQGSGGTSCCTTGVALEARDLRRSLQRTDALTVQVLFSQRLGSHEWARVVTYSSGTATADRNFSVLSFPDNGGFRGESRLVTTDAVEREDHSLPMGENEPIVYALTYDAAAGQARAYVNGTLRESWSLTGTFSNWPERNLVLGNETTSNRAFKGTIYDVKVWNRALSAAELQAQAAELLP